MILSVDLNYYPKSELNQIKTWQQNKKLLLSSWYQCELKIRSRLLETGMNRYSSVEVVNMQNQYQNCLWWWLEKKSISEDIVQAKSIWTYGKANTKTDSSVWFWRNLITEYTTEPILSKLSMEKLPISFLDPSVHRFMNSTSGKK